MRKIFILIFIAALGVSIYFLKYEKESRTKEYDSITTSEQDSSKERYGDEEKEKEEENMISNADHMKSLWYKEVSSSKPNLYRARQLFADYFQGRKLVMSSETNAYMKFLKENMINIDAEGYVLPSEKYSTSKQTVFNKATIGADWKQVFKKWKTQQNRGNDGVGVVRSIAIDPGNVSNVLAGAATAGIWRTSDKAISWNWVSQGTPHVQWVNDISYIKNSPSVVYAGTDMGIIKSVNGGATWSYTNLNSVATFPITMGELVWLGTTVHSVDTVYATVKISNQTILKRTTDGGTTWTNQQTFPVGTTIWDMKVHPRNAKIVYLLRVDQGQNWINFYRSVDGGTNFTKINSGYPADINTAAHRARLAVTPANANVVYIATAYNGGDANDMISFFKSSNAGVSFTKKCCGNVNQPLVNAMGANDFLYETCHLSQITWNFAFTVSTTNENFLACAANKLKVSNDGGATWHYDLSGQTVTGSQYDNYPQNAEHTGIHGDHHGLAVQGNDIWDTNDGGVYYSADGGQTVAKDVSDGLMVQELWGFGTAFKKDIWAVGLNHNAINVRDDAAYGGWTRFGGADAMAANVNPIDDQYLYIHPWGHEKVKRNTVQNSGHQFGNLGIELGYITLDNVEFHPNNYYTIYASDYGDRNQSYRIAKTTTNADSWQIIKSFADVQKNAVAVKLSYANPDVVYAVVEPNKVWKSTNAGSSWTEVSPPASLISSFALWRLAVSDKNPNQLWVTVKGNQNTIKVITSSDGGTTWSDYSTGLPAYAITSMIYQRGSNDGLYVGTTYGVYYRKSGMTTWEQFGTSLPAAQVSFMHLNYALGKIRIGTDRGIWENDLAEITPPKATISANKIKICPAVENATVQFADFSVLHNDAQTTYSWSFPGGNPSTSTSERPLISYASATSGQYSVTLTVKDQYGTNTQTLSNFITVSCSDYSNCSAPRDLPKSNWSIVYADGSEPTDPASNAIDGNPGTNWHTPWSASEPPYPHEIQINLGTTFLISQIKYLPRQDQENGRVANYELYVSNLTTSWGAAVKTGTFTNSASEQVISFPAKSGKYVRFKALSEVNNNPWTCIAELGVVGCLSTNTCTLQAIPRTNYRVYQKDSQEPGNEATKAIDGNIGTFWHTQWSAASPPPPHYITINLGATYNLTQLSYTPRSDNQNGRIKNYKIEVSTNATTWTQVASGTFVNSAAVQLVNFSPVQAKYVKLTAFSEVNNNNWTSIAELAFSACSTTAARTDIQQTNENESRADRTQNLEVFPSPSKSTVHVRLVDEEEGNFSLQVYSLDGKKASVRILEKNNNECKLDVSDLNKGWYIIQVSTTKGSTYKRKFMVE